MFPAGHTDRRLSATHKDTKTKTQRQRHLDHDPFIYTTRSYSVGIKKGAYAPRLSNLN